VVLNYHGELLLIDYSKRAAIELAMTTMHSEATQLKKIQPVKGAACLKCLTIW